MRLYLLLFLSFFTISASAQKTTQVAASTRYEQPSLPAKIFIGKNYRSLWAAPATMKVFSLAGTKGGLKPKKLGGGQQTKSLTLEDMAGNDWALRSVDKTVDKAMEAEGIKSGFVKKISQDMISAAEPYGALTVPPMAKALGVLTSDPEVYFVPDDPAFGEYRLLFANTVCLLELQTPVRKEGDKTKDTEELLAYLKGHPTHRLDQKSLLQARLLDMLISDWDRHGKQWKWGVFKKGGDSAIVYPIPRDHDQAYFHSTGVLIRLVRPFTLPHFIGFRKKSVKLQKLNHKEHNFDRVLMKDLNEADWRAGIQTFQAQLTDAVLEDAVKRLPPEVYAASGAQLLARLKSRRDTMMKGGMKYYRYLKKKAGDEGAKI